ncbi:MAG: M15 family metallopeptidase [Defluviitaleaceae bacterium]|nr:M15 family metallopeptidase [Defluviitaleaceae bacterium]MCL2263480.1 M15 family metallopeptidase [Defluviitaleaceae bacterium]
MRGKKNKYHPYYVGRRSARLRFLAGVCTCFMLLAAAACVGFAVFILLDTHVPTRAGDAPAHLPVAATVRETPPPTPTETPAAPPEPVVEAAAWIQIIPPEEEIYTMYIQYVIIPQEYEDIIPPVQAISYAVYVSTPAALTVYAPPIPAEYAFLPFYIHENAALYAAFLQERPYLDVETIIWKVNASVHVPFYSQIRVNHQPNPLFITPTYRLPYGFTPAMLVPVNHAECHLRATPEAVAAFVSLRTSARANGFDLAVTSAYRTARRQSELWVGGGRRDGRVARPYHSEHQTGRALDLWGPGGLLDASGPSPTGRWVADNVHYHGFIIRYRAETTHITGYIHEPWHITYVGAAIAMYMHNNNIISLEEFVGRNPGAALPQV